MTEVEKRTKRNNKQAAWPIRLVFGVLAIFLWSGVIAVWKLIGHDGYIIVAVIIPLTLFAGVMTLGAFTATRRTARDFADAILSLIYFSA